MMEKTMNKNRNVWMAIVYVLMFLGIQAFAGIVVTALALIFHNKGLTGSSAMQLIVSMVLFSVITVVVFLWTRWFKLSFSYLQSRPWVVLFWSVVAALGAILPSMFCQELLPALPEWMQKLVDESEQQMVLLMQTRGGYMVLALLAPMVEEMVFRGCVLRSLLDWKPDRRWLMIGLSALLFALSHLNPAQMPHAFVIGLLLGWMYCRTGSIVPGIVYHWANNTAAYLLFAFYPDPSVCLSDIFGSRTVLAVVFSLCILLPALFQLDQHMKKASSQF